MPTKAINSGRYKDSQDDLADKLLQYHSCTNTELPYKTSGNPIKFTAYNSADPWTIPVTISDEYLVNSEIIQGIKEGSKPQFPMTSSTYSVQSTSVLGEAAGGRVTRTARYHYYRINKRGSSIRLYDLGSGDDNRPNDWSIGERDPLQVMNYTDINGNDIVPDRIMLLCQAAGGGGGGSNGNGNGTSTGYGFIPSPGGGGGGAGATALIILDTANDWGISLGHAGFGGYGQIYDPNLSPSKQTPYQSTSACDIIISDYKAGGTSMSGNYSASGNSYVVIGGGQHGNSPTLQTWDSSKGKDMTKIWHAEEYAGGSGGTVYWARPNNNIWILQTVNGIDGGDGGCTDCRSQTGGYGLYGTTPGAMAQKTFSATNITTDKTGHNIRNTSAKNSGYGWQGGTAQIKGSYYFYTGGGGGGGASCYGAGGNGGTGSDSSDGSRHTYYGGNAPTDSYQYGGGGGGSGGNAYWDQGQTGTVSGYTERLGYFGGDGAYGFISFYWDSAK